MIDRTSNGSAGDGTWGCSIGASAGSSLRSNLFDPDGTRVELERAEDGGRGPRAVLHGTAPLVIDAARNLAGHAHPEMA